MITQQIVMLINVIFARSNGISQVRDERIERLTCVLNEFHKCVPFVGDASPWGEIGREHSYHLIIDIIFVDSVFPFKRSENGNGLWAH